MKRFVLATTVSAAVLGGCVKSSTYDKMKGDLQGQVAERDDKIASLDKALADEQATVARLEGQISEAQAELEKRQGEIDSLNGELASVVKDKARLSESAEELKEALVQLGKRKAEAERRVAQFKDLLARFKQLINAGKLRVKIADGRMVLELPTDVLFASGKADLSEGGVLAIAEVAVILATIPDRKLQVEGHTDNVPIKTRRFPSNWELASARATTVVNAMIQSGVNPGSISAASFGEHRPVADNATEEGRTSNRRIEIVVVPDLSQLPGFDELNRAMRDS